MPNSAPKARAAVASPLSTEQSGRTRAFVAVFIFSLLAVYVADRVLQTLTLVRPLRAQWGLDGRDFFRGEWWTLFSYALVHLDPLHLVVNAGALALFGYGLSEEWIWRRLALLTLVSGTGGAALWLAIHHGQRGTLIGSSAIVSGYIGAFAMSRPDGQIPLLGSRWSFPRWVLLATWIGIEGWGLWQEINNRLRPGALSHSAHIGGLAAAGFYFVQLRFSSTAWSASTNNNKDA